MKESLTKLDQFLDELHADGAIKRSDTHANAANIKGIYLAVGDINQRRVIRLWNDYIEEVCDDYAEEWRPFMARQQTFISGDTSLFSIGLSIAFIVGGWFVASWLGLLVGLVAGLVLFLHRRAEIAAHVFSNATLEQTKLKVHHTKSFIMGYQLSDKGNFLREEEPWAYMQSNDHVVEL